MIEPTVEFANVSADVRVELIFAAANAARSVVEFDPRDANVLPVFKTTFLTELILF